MRRPISNFHPIMERNPQSPISEAYRLLRVNLQYASPDARLQTIMVTSALPKEGKTTTAVNLAVAFARGESKVLLIDADLRRPAVHHAFDKPNRTGLSALLAKRHSLQEAVEDTHIDNLSLLTAGPTPPNPSELLSSRRMGELLGELKEMYDTIIIDSSPVLPVTDATVVAARCDGVLMVVQAGKVGRRAALDAKAGLDRVQANLLGVVLNRVKRKKAIEQSYFKLYA